MLTTVTTTSAPYYGRQKLIGTLDISTEIPWSTDTEKWTKDEDIVFAIVDGIATKLVVPDAWITASLSIPSKYIQVDYEITIPAETRGNQSGWALLITIVLSDDDVGRSDWGDTIGTALTRKTDEEYWVAVHSVPAPVAVFLNERGEVAHAFGARRYMVLLRTASVVSLFLLWPLLAHTH